MKFAYGMDISSLLENERHGAQFSYHGEKGELLALLVKASVNAVRLRLWVDPNSESHLSYGGGHNDLATTLSLAKRANQLKLDIVLDFHYSDFWADPGKQFKPKAWETFHDEALYQALYTHTKTVLLAFEKENIPLKWIQVGNEITNGLCWPDGQLYVNHLFQKDGLSTMIQLLKAGIKACREVSPESQIILHLDRGGDKKLYHQWFSWMQEAHVDYDIIGMSYYPYWHGSLADLGSNIAHVKMHFHKQVMIMETAYAFTSDKAKTSRQIPVIDEIKLNQLENPPKYPLSRGGQAQFMKDLLLVLRSQEVQGVFYWEPAWLPLEKNSWSTEAGRTYIHELDKGDGNEWANQGLFDFEGASTEALDVYQSIFIKEQEDEK